MTDDVDMVGDTLPLSPSGDNITLMDEEEEKLNVNLDL